jgi:hypothetical protein
LFRQFELIYVVADECDLVRLRTNYRKGEDAYLYRLRGSPERVRKFFLDYVRRVNDLHQRPEWYSALTHNCTTAIRTQRAAADRASWNWRMLVNGYGDECSTTRHLDRPAFFEFKRRSLINPRAKADQDVDFSRRMRQIYRSRSMRKESDLPNQNTERPRINPGCRPRPPVCHGCCWPALKARGRGSRVAPAGL